MTICKSEQETLEFAISFAKTLDLYAIVALEGELGAGKTCFVRGMCEGLGGDPRQVNSPTFTIMQEYEVANGKRLVHIDAYRLSGEDELETIGWDELLQDRDAIIAIEWASKIKNAIPYDHISIEIEHIDLHTRKIN
jgi:tRNA threonylcarbamoyladenosine biosynthesis protein TsaE